MRWTISFFALSLLVLGGPPRAFAQEVPSAPNASEDGPILQDAVTPDDVPIPREDPRDPICPLVEGAARDNALPVDFLVRVIWRESRFQPNVVGPLTRSGKRAQGIAQFMPGTAAERRLIEPFNPVEALPKSGEFLAELRDQFGNLGLAAAAYNAGPQRLRDFLTSSRELPLETRNYVLAITNRPVEDWVKLNKAAPDDQAIGGPSAALSPASCHDLISLLRKTPNPLVAQLPQRQVPSWCSALHHPNTSVCGRVHERMPVFTIAEVLKQKSHVNLTASTSH
jgi:Transglycosylase SLT domain